ncbi:MAG: deoxyguanosinetriphosphate triphosphohydrolase [Defluviitaleaceae bacterium]|nr:deoxyguanosinetriphosphate triphosphohydrolase [Defluviitaleaceae bacterium]MCL2262278.1 deoxyguanosinetriphosphate triphosphohydrolase [Defluviitaleaceae bacterium]
MNIREQREKLERKTLSPTAAKSAETKGRKVACEKCDIRTEFQKDRDRITHCKAFRRLMHKTQVFISPERDHYRTRLTHTLEVAQISRTAARALGLNEDLTEAIALGHDLGHTPFGHTGEDALNGLIDGGFRHNEQSVRVVETLENLNLTHEVIDGIMNHRTTCKPSTQEGRIVQLCDKIAYMNHDVDDAIRAKILEQNELPKSVLEMFGATPAKRIDFLVRNLVQNSLECGEIGLSASAAATLKEFRTFMFERVYANQLHSKERGKIKTMLRLMYEHYLQHPQKLPPESLARFDENPQSAIADHIAGMTDRFAQKRFTEFFMPSAWEV